MSPNAPSSSMNYFLLIVCNEANDSAGKKKVAMFLIAAGQKNYEILRHHSTPKRPRERSFEEIVTLLMQHFQDICQLTFNHRQTTLHKIHTIKRILGNHRQILHSHRSREKVNKIAV